MSPLPEITEDDMKTMTRREQDNVLEETLLAKSILKRKEWAMKYGTS